MLIKIEINLKNKKNSQNCGIATKHVT
jgi:hypothetical protein